MTARCRILISIAIVGGLLGVLRGQDTLTILCLACLIWIFGSWCAFQIRMLFVWPQLSCQRRFGGRAGERSTLWAGRKTNCEVVVAVASGRLPFRIVAHEMLPEAIRCEAPVQALVAEPASRSLRWNFNFVPLSAGVLRFDGVALQFFDLQGLFVRERYLAQPLSMKCLPTYSAAAEVRPTIKRINSLPQHGIHRLERAGLGSELLELREYQPGDPPKSIAWKVSARRDRLMTRQYESEVAVRVNLIVDVSAPTRIGSFGTRSLDQIHFAAASVARAALSAGDVVGLAMIGDQPAVRMKAAGGDRTFYQLLESLAQSGSQPTTAESHYSFSQVRAAASFCRRRYPELWQSNINSVPFSLWPVLPWRRRFWQDRVRLSSVLAELNSLTPTAACELMYDDALLARFISRTLTEHGWAWSPPLLMKRPLGRGNDGDDNWAQTLRAEIMRCVAHARDNEVIVLIADLLSHDDATETLVQVSKTAVARHHRVICLCPTAVIDGQADETLRTARDPSPESVEAPRPDENVEPPSEWKLEQQALATAERIERERRLAALKRMLRSAGARVAFISDRNAIDIVLAEVELAGTGRMRRTGAGA